MLNKDCNVISGINFYPINPAGPAVLLANSIFHVLITTSNNKTGMRISKKSLNKDAVFKFIPLDNVDLTHSQYDIIKTNSGNLLIYWAKGQWYDFDYDTLYLMQLDANMNVRNTRTIINPLRIDFGVNYKQSIVSKLGTGICIQSSDINNSNSFFYIDSSLSTSCLENFPFIAKSKPVSRSYYGSPAIYTKVSPTHFGIVAGSLICVDTIFDIRDTCIYKKGGGGDTIFTLKQKSINKINSSITISPNPATNFITISLPQNVSSALVKTYDVAGREIAQQKINSSAQKINISRLAAGEYFVHVWYDGKEEKQKLIVE